MSKKSVALCSCPDRMIKNDGFVNDAKQRMSQLEIGVVSLNFAIAATFEDCSTEIWRDALDLVKYLTEYEEIVTFNGHKFDLVLLAAQAARELTQKENVQELVDSDEFYQVYNELTKRSFDLMELTKNATGTVCNLANLAASTFHYVRKTNVVIATSALQDADVITAVNFVLEGAMLAYNLRYVAGKTGKLSVKGPDDRMIVFDA